MMEEDYDEFVNGATRGASMPNLTGTQMASLTPDAVQNDNLHLNKGKGVEGSKSGVIQNENLHILQGKAVDGAKSGIIQQENLHVLRGKVIEGFKAEIPKPAKARRQGRKALTDLSRARKPVLPAASKAKAPIDKSTHEKAQKSNSILIDEETIKEWAKDGIEHMHFTFTEQLEFEEKQKEERVKKGIALALGGLREWTDMSFGLEIPVEEVPSDTEDTFQWKYELEVLPPYTPRARSPETSGGEEYYDDILYSWDFDCRMELKEESEDDDV